MNIVQTDGRPFFIGNGETGCLLVHGFTGAPKEMRLLGEHLAEDGYTVLGTRLFGHATDQTDLIRARWGDWLLSVEDGYHILSGTCTQIFILGLSMGGILALLISSNFPVSGVIAYSTPYEFPVARIRPFIPLIPLISKFRPFFSKGEPDWNDPSQTHDHFEYTDYPVRAAYELNVLLKKMRRALPKINVPVLQVHSKVDKSVPPYHAERIFEKLGSRDKRLLWLENSGHVVIEDSQRSMVFEATSDFIQSRSSVVSKS
ncbi:MAG: alpha/beta fold hydrolase [Chloroflexi bacterium]|nr:alpha/beta fold hydrolase [Chloroflexota bacterium]